MQKERGLLLWISGSLCRSQEMQRPFAPTYRIGEDGCVQMPHFPAMKRGVRRRFREAWRGTLPQGDVGSEIRAFDCMPINSFWEEQDWRGLKHGNILFDYSATDFQSCGSAVSIADSGIKRLYGACRVPLGRRTFPDAFDSRNIIKPIWKINNTKDSTGYQKNRI